MPLRVPTINRREFLSWAAAGLAGTARAGAAPAATRTLSDLAALKDALENTANPGDVLLLAPGVYAPDVPRLSVRRTSPWHPHAIGPQSVLSPIEKLMASPTRCLPLIQKNAPTALISRVMPVAFSSDVGRPAPARTSALFLSASLAVISVPPL